MMVRDSVGAMQRRLYIRRGGKHRGLPNRAIWTWMQRFHAAMGMPPPGGGALVNKVDGCAISTSLEPSLVHITGTGLSARSCFRPAVAVRPATAPQAQLLTKTAQRQSDSSIGKDELLPVVVDVNAPYFMGFRCKVQHTRFKQSLERLVICQA